MEPASIDLEEHRRPMRVLHVAPGNLYGGVETLLVTLAKYRETAPMEPEFAVCFEGRLARELEASGVKVHRLGAARVRNPVSVLRARRRLAALLTKSHYGAAICHMAWPQALFGATIKAGNVPLIFWLHLATDGRHWLERWAGLTRPAVAICPSQFVGERLKNMYPGLAPEIIHYPIAPPAIADRDATRRQVRAELGIADDAVVIIQASRMEPWKGQMQCLRGLAQLRDLDSWICVQAGGPQRPFERDYFEALTKAAAELGIAERVRFLGLRNDVPRLMSAADIYCQPNTGLEGLPIVFGEAMYAGLPIVSSRIGGFWELVDESSGILAPSDDILSLASALRSLIESSDLRNRLGRSARDRAIAFFDPAQQIRKLFAIVTKVR